MEEEEPVCSHCKATSSLMWQKNKDGDVVCLDCHSDTKQDHGNKTGSSPERLAAATTSNGSAAPVSTGRRTRLRNAKGRPSKAAEKQKSANSHGSSPSQTSQGGNAGGAARKGGGASGRRSLVKGKPVKAPEPAATIVTSDTILHKGTTYEVGDIVSILGEEGQLYYALIRGFLEDQYAEKYAILTWLIPTIPNPKNFDPSLFVLGPEEDGPRGMELLEFVTHSPQSNSFLSSLGQDHDMARLWTSKRRRTS